jgi:hypothetical protein
MQRELRLLKEQGDACNELALMHPEQRVAYAACYTAFRHHEQRIREAYEQERQQQAALLGDCLQVLTQAYEAMGYLGDILNNMDIVDDEDELKVNPAFDSVRALLNKLQQAGVGGGGEKE